MSEHIIPYMESCGQKTYFYTYRPHWKELRKSQAKFHDFHLPNPHIFTPQTFSIMGFFTNEQMFGKFSQKKTSSNWVKAKNFIWCTFFLILKLRKTSISTKQPTNQLLVDPTVHGCTWLKLINYWFHQPTNQLKKSYDWFHQPLVEKLILWKWVYFYQNWQFGFDDWWPNLLVLRNKNHSINL